MNLSTSSLAKAGSVLVLLILPLVLMPASGGAWAFGRARRNGRAGIDAGADSTKQAHPTFVVDSMPSAPQPVVDIGIAASRGVGSPSYDSTMYKAGEGDRDTLALIYDSLAGESDTLRAVADAIGTKRDLQQAHIDAIQSLWEVHATNMHKHLVSTESFLLPKLKQHTDIPLAAVLRSHRSIKSRMAAVQSSVLSLHAGSASKDRRVLVHRLEEYSSELHSHFSFSKQSLLHQSKQAMTASQWGRTLQKYMEKGGVEMGSFIHHMGVQTFRDEWMSFCKLPQFLWSVYFRKGWEKFESKWQPHVAALQ